MGRRWYYIAAVAIVSALNIALAVGFAAAAARVPEWRDLATAEGSQVARIGQRCAINRVDGSAVCPPGTFGTIRVVWP